LKVWKNFGARQKNGYMIIIITDHMTVSKDCPPFFTQKNPSGEYYPEGKKDK